MRSAPWVSQSSTGAPWRGPHHACGSWCCQNLPERAAIGRRVEEIGPVHIHVLQKVLKSQNLDRLTHDENCVINNARRVTRTPRLFCTKRPSRTESEREI